MGEKQPAGSKDLKTSNFRNRVRIRETSMVLAVLVIGSVGTYLLTLSHAATPTASFQTEAGTRTANAVAVADTTASGSQALRFTAPSGGTGTCAVSTPNVPDGPDPWGGCWPGPSNTGTPAGTVLSTYTGSCTISVANTVIDSKTVNCSLNIAASGVVIKNSKINGSILSGDNSDSVTVTDTTIDAGPVNGTVNDGARGILDRNFTAIRIHTIRGISGGWCQYNCKLQDSYIHGQDPDEGGAAHESGMRQGSGTAVRAQQFIHNTIRCDAPEIPPDAGCSADMTGYGDFDTIQNNYVYRNLLQDSPQGAFCAYGGASSPKPFPNNNNNEWIDNIFQRGSNGKCSTYGPIVDMAAGVRGNVWTNNRWSTGELVPPN